MGVRCAVEKCGPQCTVIRSLSDRLFALCSNVLARILQYGRLIAQYGYRESRYDMVAVSIVTSNFGKGGSSLNEKASECLSLDGLTGKSGVGWDNQLEPCLLCTMSGSGTVSWERETTKLLRRVLTIDRPCRSLGCRS